MKISAALARFAASRFARPRGPCLPETECNRFRLRRKFRGVFDPQKRWENSRFFFFAPARAFPGLHRNFTHGSLRYQPVQCYNHVSRTTKAGRREAVFTVMCGFRCKAFAANGRKTPALRLNAGFQFSPAVISCLQSGRAWASRHRVGEAIIKLLLSVPEKN